MSKRARHDLGRDLAADRRRPREPHRRPAGRAGVARLARFAVGSGGRAAGHGGQRLGEQVRRGEEVVGRDRRPAVVQEAQPREVAGPVRQRVVRRRVHDLHLAVVHARRSDGGRARGRARGTRRAGGCGASRSSRSGWSQTLPLVATRFGAEPVIVCTPPQPIHGDAEHGDADVTTTRISPGAGSSASSVTPGEDADVAAGGVLDLLGRFLHLRADGLDAARIDQAGCRRTRGCRSSTVR